MNISDYSVVAMSSGSKAISGRVGSKAGGFIAKKFFHPTNRRNLERLWKAQEDKRIVIIRLESKKRLSLDLYIKKDFSILWQFKGALSTFQSRI